MKYEYCDSGVEADGLIPNFVFGSRNGLQDYQLNLDNT